MELADSTIFPGTVPEGAPAAGVGAASDTVVALRAFAIAAFVCFACFNAAFFAALRDPLPFVVAVAAVGLSFALALAVDFRGGIVIVMMS